MSFLGDVHFGSEGSYEKGYNDGNVCKANTGDEHGNGQKHRNQDATSRNLLLLRLMTNITRLLINF